MRPRVLDGEKPWQSDKKVECWNKSMEGKENTVGFRGSITRIPSFDHGQGSLLKSPRTKRRLE